VRALRSLGYRILLAEDGEDAWRVVDKYNGPIDIAVTDVALPRVGGAVLADRLVARNPNL
jgi:CheY-like chemotaxis protein